MKPLFDNAATADDPVYNSIRDDPCPEVQDIRMFAEDLWKKYHPYADDHFLVEIQKDFHARFWEMYLACTLMDKGYKITSKNIGPDIRVEHKGNIIWIEAIAPTAGEGCDRVPELVITKPPTAQRVPEEQIILKYCNAIDEKYANKYCGYLRNGTIAGKDCYVIAINGCRIPSSRTDFYPYRIVRTVLPIGYLRVPVNTGSNQITRESCQYRPNISKARGSSVRTDIFADPHYKHISAVLFSNVDAANHTKSMGGDFITVHNPLACEQLPNDFLNFGCEFRAEFLKDEKGEIIEITVSSKDWGKEA